MTCHKLTAGDGYTYLTRQVAAGDVAPAARDSADLTAYYQATGNPPGIWVGSGCEALGVAGIVSEAQMQALFGEGLHPDADTLIAEQIQTGVGIKDAIKAARLGRRYAVHGNNIPFVSELSAAYQRFEEKLHRRPTIAERRQIKYDTAHALLTAADPAKTYTPQDIRSYITDELGRARQAVAGFDLVFTPSKSVSVLWGLSTSDIHDIVAAAHETAWRDALAYIEREGAFTRIGAGGIAQVDTQGLVATAFTHYDSRAGDPNLHTHVAVANRVLADDGIWRTLDGQQLYRIAVSASEFYNARIEEELTRQLGVRFVDHERGPGKRPVREIDGIPDILITGFSRRRTSIEATYDRLVADYVRQYGSAPPRTVQIRLAQQACLEDRPDKEDLRPLANQIEEWLARAEYMLPDQDIHELMAATVHRGAQIDIDAGLAEVSGRVTELAETVIEKVSATRSSWTVYHVRAEVLRMLRGVPFETPEDRLRMVESVVEHALGTASIQLDIQPDATPVLLQRHDGELVFRRHGSERYTSTGILEAEDRLLDDARTHRGARVSAPMVDLTLRDTRAQLDPGQRQVVRHFVSSGRALAVAVGPPGAGKAPPCARSATSGRPPGTASSAWHPPPSEPVSSDSNSALRQPHWTG
jgi:conjugative relaxase-like TrwC/TraI family protein